VLALLGVGRTREWDGCIDLREVTALTSLVTATIQVDLHGSTPGAQAELRSAIQAYADSLATESQKQELSLRPPGAMNIEVSYNAVRRAREAINRYGERAKMRPFDMACAGGVPIFSGATGVMGSYLHSPLQIVVFSVLSVLAAITVFFSIRGGR
jgi:hypothetical protein